MGCPGNNADPRHLVADFLFLKRIAALSSIEFEEGGARRSTHGQPCHALTRRDLTNAALPLEAVE